MSSIEEVDNVVEIFDSVDKYLFSVQVPILVLLMNINLNVIKTLKDRYKNKICGVGFSGHHTGIAPDLAAYMLGSKIIERHYTLDRSMKGTDLLHLLN